MSSEDLKKNSQELLITQLKEKLNPARIPAHVAIIMDGNGRWAQVRGLPRVAGHRLGVETLRLIIKACLNLGIKVLTVYAFSTENWKRPEEEVNLLMSLLCEYIGKEAEKLRRNGVQIRTIGCIEELPSSAQEAIKYAVNLTLNSSRLVLNVALNYGGRREIINAVRKIAQKARKQELDPFSIDEKVFSDYLDTAGLPDPDLLIRPAGEWRISNFLLWQVAYTEFWNSPIFWPDFREEHFLQAIIDYQKRERRFGGL